MSRERCRLQKISHGFPLRLPDGPLHAHWWRAAPGLLRLLPVTNGHRKPETQQGTGVPDLTPSFHSYNGKVLRVLFFVSKKKALWCAILSLSTLSLEKKHCPFELPVALPVISKQPSEVPCLIIHWICLNLPQKSPSSSQSEVVCLKQLRMVGCSVILTD